MQGVPIVDEKGKGSVCGKATKGTARGEAGVLYKGKSAERGKRDFDCDKQVERVVTAPNCMLKGSWGEGGSGGIRKKLKSEYAAYLESKFRRNDGSSI